MHQRLIAALLLLSITAQSQAALSDAMNTMLSNVTNASAFSTADRTGFQGGGVAIRSPISPINIVAFDPPRISAGCGGLNYFGGSFSLINKDQFVALLRKIAQNSLGLAFKMAVDVVNKELGGAIDYIFKIMHDANNALSNTCAVSQGLMNLASSSASSLLDSQKAEASEAAAASGQIDDTIMGTINSSIQGVGTFISGLAGSTNASAAGNPIWNMIVGQQAGDQLFSGGINIGLNSTINNEILLSMTGFVILNSSSFVQQNLGASADTGSDGATAMQNTNKQIGYHERTLTISDLRDGWSGTSTTVGVQPKKAVYICNPDINPNDQTPDCTAFQLSTDNVNGNLINQQTSTDISFLGMMGFVNNALFGNPQGDTSLIGGSNATNTNGPITPAGSASNAIDAIINGVKLTDAQAGVIGTTRLPVMPLIYYASGGFQDRAAAFEEAKILAPIIADEYTYVYVSAVVTLLHKFMNSTSVQKNIPKDMYKTAEYWEKERNAAAETNKNIVNRLIAADSFAHATKSYNPALGFSVKSTK